MENVYETILQYGIQLKDYVFSHPLEFVLQIVVTVIAIRLSLSLFRLIYALFFYSTNLVYLRVTMPREESQKDKEKADEKDFKEKISIMDQFFRNIHELGELSLHNIIMTRLFRADIVSFELVAQKKVVEFYVVMHKKYQEMLEKQITSYYPNADIQVEKPYELKPKGNQLKLYYAFQKNA